LLFSRRWSGVVWRGVVLWIGIILASVALLVVGALEAERILWTDVGLLSVAMMVGPAWAYFDWRRSRSQLRARDLRIVPIS